MTDLTPRLAVDTILSGLNPKTTEGMRQALHSMAGHLQCPLCQTLYTNPSTLGCGHSFCSACITAYSGDNYDCPVKGCGQPVSMRGQSKQYGVPNPTLSTMVESLEQLCHRLARADDQWWTQDADGDNEAAIEEGVEDPAPAAPSSPIDLMAQPQDDDDDDLTEDADEDFETALS